MSRLRIENIGECYTGRIGQPVQAWGSMDIEAGRISALGAAASGHYEAVIDANGGAVMPGIIDGHVHPMLGEWTPTQNAIGWIRNYLHGGTTTMISAGELHVPGLDYGNLTPELVTAIALVTASTTGRVRWSGVKVHAGTCVVVPGMREEHFDRLAAAGARFIKFIFFPLEERRDEAETIMGWARARGMRVKVHTGGVSRSGASRLCGYPTLSWLKPDVAAHVSGGPIPMPDEDIDALVDQTEFALEVCASANDRSTLRLVRRLAAAGRLDRLVLGTDTPGGTGVIPRGMFRTLLFLTGVCGVAPADAIACATGNTARAHGLEVGLLETGRPADILVFNRVEGSRGPGLAQALAHGDFPGISFVLADGVPLVGGRSEQTPPPARAARFSCCNLDWLGVAAAQDRPHH
jgi:enamidase